jgi:hypothetical protein
MYPEYVSYNDISLFRQKLGQKGKNSIEWKIWQYSYRKAKFQALTETFRFLGLTNEKDALTPLGKRLVFGRDDSSLIIGLFQSEYFELFQLLVNPKSKDELLNTLSLNCDIPFSEKQRRSMLNSFIDLSINAGLLTDEKEKISLNKSGRDNLEEHRKRPLWVSNMPLFDESKRIEQFKALYYETGHPFRDIVKEAFSELGFQSEFLPKKTSGIPDVMISIGDFRAVIETKGERKQIGENAVNYFLH